MTPLLGQLFVPIVGCRVIRIVAKGDEELLIREGLWEGGGADRASDGKCGGRFP